MSLICPVCKADNTSGSACRRCKADLSMLLAIEHQRAELLLRSRHLLLQDPVGALDLARRADELRRDGESLRWLAILLVATGNFAPAWQSWRMAEGHG